MGNLSFLQKIRLLAVGLAIIIAVCFFEFIYLLWTGSGAWAVIPFGLGFGALLSMILLEDEEKGILKKKD